MRFTVKLPDYPCEHVVTGLTTGRGASGRKLLLAVAEWKREGMREAIPCRDLVTLMMLHDVVSGRAGGPVNAAKLYGAGRATSARRIAGATVEG